VSRYLEEEEGRVEVILEGSDRIDSTWKEYNFRFKPGNISDRLPIACTLLCCSNVLSSALPLTSLRKADGTLSKIRRQKLAPISGACVALIRIHCVRQREF